MCVLKGILAFCKYDYDITTQRMMKKTMKVIEKNNDKSSLENER